MKNRRNFTQPSSIRKYVYTFGSVAVFFLVLILLWWKTPKHSSIDRLSIIKKGNTFARELEKIQSLSHDLPVPIFVVPHYIEQPKEEIPIEKSIIEETKAKPSLGMDTVLLIICSNRPDYLKRTLTHVVKNHPKTSVPIFISEDGSSEDVKRVIDQARDDLVKSGSSVPFVHKHHPSTNQRYENGYFKLADHFKWALNEVFTNAELFFPTIAVQRVIILEEDLQIAPDFFEFFAATKDMLDTDKSLLAVSAWNDNGLKNLVKDNKALYRSDFFPGLGWMMTRSLWVDELAVKWPRAYWDDWLREPKQRQGRHIIRPEVCRTLHFGTHGVSNAQYSDYLNTIVLNEEFVPFTSMELSYLVQTNWDNEYLSRVRNAPMISRSNNVPSDAKEVRVLYTSLNDFPAVAHWAGAMDNIKANVPRTAYKGIVSVWRGDVKVHLVPKEFA